MKRFKIIIIAFLIVAFSGKAGLHAQQKDRILPKGNQDYADNKFVDAEANYRISDSKFPNKAAAPFNLGNSIYKQKHSSEAKFAYAKALKNSKTRPQKHRAFHNLGNVFMNEKDYTQAVEAYKNALRNDPTDEETRYNYALAKKMLKDNPPKDDKKKDEKKDQEKKDDKKDDKKDGEKDKKDDKEKDKKDDKGDQDKQNKDPKPNDKGEPKPAPGGISKERLENLLDAVNKEEKKVQDKVNAQKVKGKPVKTEKDW
ncbi:tetratricopeptide repeat protein [Flavobacterium sp. Sr18]|uniref:tetratricopeptide repeat protein n=1 Tax=Flavobacterium sp. Sr18 TaxID=935222 RepID=UPI0013E41598|nr:tetratricopeptide repeat protein [Flavobacterium sp. Sr18]QIH38856.1 tetratricopeptide repeat protein [Flavobacterium sp. Sr18]